MLIRRSNLRSKSAGAKRTRLLFGRVERCLDPLDPTEIEIKQLTEVVGRALCTADLEPVVEIVCGSVSTGTSWTWHALAIVDRLSLRLTAAVESEFDCATRR